MRDIVSKTDYITEITAEEFNSDQAELENIVKSADFTLDPAGGPNTDLNMLAKAMTAYANAGLVYQNSGTANAIVLSIGSNLVLPYAYYDGMKVTFKVIQSNTGATTIKIGSLAAKDLYLPNGNVLTASDIVKNRYETAIYRLAVDRFELQQQKYPLKLYTELNGDFTVVKGSMAAPVVWTTEYAECIPIRKSSTWFLLFNIKGNLSDSTGISYIKISGTDFATGSQVIIGRAFDPVSSMGTNISVGSTDEFLLFQTPSGTDFDVLLSGCIQLTEKPTWAD